MAVYAVIDPCINHMVDGTVVGRNDAIVRIVPSIQGLAKVIYLYVMVDYQKGKEEDSMGLVICY